MYKKILVSLDGSELAECVLPHVEALAKGCQVEKIFLVRVLEPFEPVGAVEHAFGPEDILQRNLEVRRTDAEAYLKNLRGRIDYHGSRTEWGVLSGKVAETIADYSTKNEMDLIVIATHGRSGVSRWVWGSVADRILRSSCVPVLMVRAPGCCQPGV
jgi:nucleotide-binding universal stress UspA family protein